MLVLSFDTAMAACSAAVVRIDAGGPETLASHHEARTKGHAEVLVPMIAEVMASAALSFSDLDRIAVTTGPGTFTGVRIGVATARGMAVASGLPVIGITTLEAVAAGAVEAGTSRGRPIAVVFDARRDQVYVQCFSPDLEPLSDPLALGYDDARAAIECHDPVVVGSGAGLIRTGGGELSSAAGREVLPTARIVAGRAALRTISSEPVVPLYLRPPDAKLPK